jgi:hypothetical protein
MDAERLERSQEVIRIFRFVDDRSHVDGMASSAVTDSQRFDDAFEAPDASRSCNVENYKGLVRIRHCSVCRLTGRPSLSRVRRRLASKGHPGRMPWASWLTAVGPGCCDIVTRVECYSVLRAESSMTARQRELSWLQSPVATVLG